MRFAAILNSGQVIEYSELSADLKEYITDMREVLNLTENLDVTLVVGSDEKHLKAHRNILSAR